MLTQQDIEDMKKYLQKYDDFCKTQLCDETCKVYVKSTAEKKSCFKAFCDMQKSADLSGTQV